MYRLLMLLILIGPVMGRDILTPVGMFVEHDGYYLQYSEKHEQPYWVAYILTSENLELPYERRGSFRRDPLVFSETASSADYYKSGYDRGHLAPSRDFPQNTPETFYYSNISPQLPGFNRGVWKRLEAFVRAKAVSLGSIYITTGPIFSDSSNSLGINRVSIPRAFYKVVLYVGEDGSMESIGFILKHESSPAEVETFAVSVDSVEVVTGINFFSGLTREEELRTEQTFDSYFWGF